MMGYGQGMMGMGPGMMGMGSGMMGYGRGMMGYGRGMMGMGPGMMGMGPGMMGYGQGMMGLGPGMMGYGRGMRGMGPGMMGMGFGSGLSDQQQKKLTDLRIKFVQEMAKARVEVIQTRSALMALLMDPSAKEEAIEEQTKKTAEAYARMIVLRIKRGRQMQGVFTKEQREQMMRRSMGGQGSMRPGGGMMGPGSMMPGGPKSSQ
jgi:hypothetical protein